MMDVGILTADRMAPKKAHGSRGTGDDDDEEEEEETLVCDGGCGFCICCRSMMDNNSCTPRCSESSVSMTSAVNRRLHR